MTNARGDIALTRRQDRTYRNELKIMKLRSLILFLFGIKISVHFKI